MDEPETTFWESRQYLRSRIPFNKEEGIICHLKFGTKERRAISGNAIFIVTIGNAFVR
jgi:hypothetical protein